MEGLIPNWVHKLSPGVISLIGFFVVVHVVVLVSLAIYYSKTKSSPDFKSKLK
jgi:hypothetical protein